MNRLARLVLVTLLACASAQAFPVVTNSIIFNPNESTGEFDDFLWRWSGWDDIALEMRFSNTVFDAETAGIRLAYPQAGRVFLEKTGIAFSNVNEVITNTETITVCYPAVTTITSRDTQEVRNISVGFYGEDFATISTTITLPTNSIVTNAVAGCTNLVATNTVTWAIGNGTSVSNYYTAQVVENRSIYGTVIGNNATLVSQNTNAPLRITNGTAAAWSLYVPYSVTNLQTAVVGSVLVQPDNTWTGKYQIRVSATLYNACWISLNPIYTNSSYGAAVEDGAIVDYPTNGIYWRVPVTSSPFQSESILFSIAPVKEAGVFSVTTNGGVLVSTSKPSAVNVTSLVYKVYTDVYARAYTTLSRTNVPPTGQYYAEVLAYDGDTTNAAPSRSLAKGQVTTEHSIWSITNYAGWTNSSTGPWNYLQSNGKVPMAGDLNMGGHSVTNVDTLEFVGGSTIASSNVTLWNSFLSSTSGLTASTLFGGAITGTYDNLQLKDPSGITATSVSASVVYYRTNATAQTETGATYWDAAKGALSVVMDRTNPDGTPVINELGYNGYFRVQNRSGITISNGWLVSVTPYAGDSLAVIPAQAGTTNNKVIGMATHDIAHNAVGIINLFGEVGGLNTASLTESAPVYLSTNRGRWTVDYAGEGQVSPIHVGYVTYAHANNGRIAVAICDGGEIDPLFARWLGTNTLASPTGIYSKIESDARFATTAMVAAVSSVANGAVQETDATYTGTVALAAGAAQQGGDITGRWFAAGNIATGLNAFVGGGIENSAIGTFSAVAAGRQNSSLGMYSSISGGYQNQATGNLSSVSGGNANQAKGYYSFIGGGLANIAEGYRATIIGGFQNVASGTNAVALGINAKATNNGSFVWSGTGTSLDIFGSQGDNTFNARAVGGVYFLAPSLLIQDTNGNTVVSFSPTGSVFNGAVSFVGAPSLVTIAAGNTNYYRYTTPPASNGAYGLPHQMAYDSTNIYLYHAGSSKWLRAAATLEW